MNIKEENMQATLNTPTSMGSNFEKSFSKNVHLDEYDNQLDEANYKLKKKIFNLAKMEALVFKDPKLVAIYDDMQVSGKERYGYHANETILNIMFNDYVLNSSKYLQKYKMAIPKKKKRRDKSGINALKKNAEKQLEKSRMKKEVDESMFDDLYDDFMNEPIVGDGDDMGAELGDYQPTNFEKQINNVGNKISSTAGNVYNKFKDKFNNITNKRSIEEETSASSVGGDASYVGYSGPAAWSSKGDLIKGSKSNGNKNVGGGSSAGVMRKPMWPGGTIVAENYLTESSFFEKKLQQINEINLNLNAALREKYSPKVDEVTRKEMDAEETEETTAFNSGTIKNWNDADAKLEYNTLKKGIAEEATNQSMISDNPNSITNDTTQTMANTIDNPEKSTSNIERGALSTDKISENSLFDKLDEELNLLNKYQHKLNSMMEDRKSNSQIINDRVTAQNPKNFKSDMKNSGTKDIIKLDNFLQTKDDITEIGDNPHKGTEELEKNELSKTKGEGFKNVGNSGNEKGNEIPKRNMTTEEQHEVDLYREGLGDYIYENPSKQFEDRMKTDMGERDYKLRQERINAKKDMPLYSKGEQPTNKKESDPKYNDNLAETFVTGRYKDSIGRSHIIDFMIKESVVTDSINESWSKIQLDGLGNTYVNKIKADESKLGINESIVDLINNTGFYIDNDKKIYSVKNIKLLNESNNKHIIQESNEVKKMKNLLGYRTSKYVDNRFNKRF